MSYDILAVTFEIDGQRCADGRFTVPGGGRVAKVREEFDRISQLSGD